MNKGEKAKKILERISGAEKYFDDMSVPEEEKQKHRDKYDELLKKKSKLCIHYSELIGEKFVMDKGNIYFIESGLIYSKKELDSLKSIDKDEVKKIHRAKKMFDGKVLSVNGGSKGAK